MSGTESRPQISFTQEAETGKEPGAAAGVSQLSLTDVGVDVIR